MGDFRTRKRPPPRGEEGAGLRGERPLVAQLEFVHAPRLRQPVGATKIGQLDELADVVPEQCGTTAGAHPCSRGALAALDHHLNTHGLIRHLRRAPCIPAVNGRAVEREDFRVNVASGGAGFCCVCHASDITPTRGTCATRRSLEFSGHPPLPNGPQITERNATHARRARHARRSTTCTYNH